MGQKTSPKDVNELAASILSQVTGLDRPNLSSQKDPAAVALGRKGGLKGGKARAEKLSAKKRKAIAQKAARARWGKHSGA
jgi:hypothetical protein